MKNRVQELVEKLNEYLGSPQYDPHGDPIPDQDGNFADLSFTKLSKLKVNDKGTITGVSEHSSPFLKHLENSPKFTNLVSLNMKKV